MTTAKDVVGVYDADLNQLFPDARAIKAIVKPIAKVAKHPVETGGTISDNVIYLPIEIELSVILRPGTYRQTYQLIKNVFNSAALLTVQTKTDSYANMLLEKMPHDEDPGFFDTVAMALSFSQFQLVTAQYKTLPPVKRARNKTAVKTGQKTAKPATPAQTSAAYDIFFGH